MITKIKTYWAQLTLLTGAWHKITDEDYYEEFLQPNCDLPSKVNSNTLADSKEANFADILNTKLK